MREPPRTEAAIRADDERMISTSTIDYRTSAELSISRSQKAGRQPMMYRKFAMAAEAIRFAIDELPADLVPGTIL